MRIPEDKLFPAAVHTFSLTEGGHTGLNPIAHGDLTGSNVLIDACGKAYLADFGLAGTINRLTGMTYLAKLSCHPGAIRWTAPELLSGEESGSVVTTRSDMYSFGSIMLQVLTGIIPWHHLANDTVILLKVIEGKIHPRPDVCCVTDQHWNFMISCWSTTPIDRPSAIEALQFVACEISLLRLDGRLVTDTSAPNNRHVSHSSRPSSPSYPYTCVEHLSPAPPQSHTAVLIAGPSGTNSSGQDCLHSYNHAGVARDDPMHSLVR